MADPPRTGTICNNSTSGLINVVVVVKKKLNWLCACVHGFGQTVELNQCGPAFSSDNRVIDILNFPPPSSLISLQHKVYQTI